MKNNLVLFISFCGLIFLFASACCEDTAIPIPDPCDGEEPINADFRTLQVYPINGDVPKVFESDTFVYGSTITFSANQSLNKYKWHVGTDPTIFTADSFALDFNVIGDIDVTLIVDSSPNLDCYPNDDGRDTVTKTITLIPTESAAIFGKYEGYRTSRPNDIFVTEIKRVWNEEESWFVNFLLNFPDGCHLNQNLPLDEGITIRVSHDYCQLSPFVLNVITCPEPYGWGVLNEDHTELTLDYSIYDHDQGKRIEEQFIGTRID